MIDEEIQESQSEDIFLYSDEEVIVQVMNDITELFKKYTYRYHPMIDPIEFTVTAKPFLDTFEGYIKNIPVKVALKNGKVIYEATPDQSRFNEVPFNTTEIDVPINILPPDENAEDPFA